MSLSIKAIASSISPNSNPRESEMGSISARMSLSIKAIALSAVVVSTAGMLHLSGPTPGLSRRRLELLLRSNLSLNASCSSDASTDTFCSRVSTGRIGSLSYGSRRKQGVSRPEKIAAKLEKMVLDGEVTDPPDFLRGKRRCAWVTPNADPCYAPFRDEEWGVPVHDDRKLFELLVLSGVSAELTWPAILSKRHIFREVFHGFRSCSNF